MMKQGIFALLLALFLGAAAAFFKPATPYQVPAENTLFFAAVGGKSFDAGLDNLEIEADTNITPSRKCGFCMG
jgi:hypothetical protein